MPNGKYGRAVPRLALAVAQYRALFGEWPTHAHGSGVMAIINEPGDHSDPDDFVEYRPEIAERVRRRLICDGEGAGIQVSGRAGRCGFGHGPGGETPEFHEAYEWLYGEVSWRKQARSRPEPPPKRKGTYAELIERLEEQDDIVLGGGLAWSDLTPDDRTWMKREARLAEDAATDSDGTGLERDAGRPDGVPAPAAPPPSSEEATATIPGGEALLRTLESRFVGSAIGPNIWVPAEEGSLASLATPEELADDLDLSDDEVVGAIAPGMELRTLFDWEWSGPPGGGCWVELVRLGGREYLQMNNDGGYVLPRAFAAIEAGNDESLNEVFRRLVATNGAAFDLEIMRDLPDILTNSVPNRLRRDVVFASHLTCCGRLDESVEDLRDRVRLWLEREQEFSAGSEEGPASERTEDGVESAPARLNDWGSREAIFKAYFEQAYLERSA